MAEKPEQIELHAVYRKDHSFTICDQHGRTFKGEPESMRSPLSDQVLIGVELEAPRWATEAPHVTVSIRVPLEVEERLPDWMQEYLRGRA